MRTQTLDPEWDTAIVIQQEADGLTKQVEFRVRAAALSPSQYWEDFLQHMTPTSGLCPNNKHIEDTGISVEAVGIALWSLHYEYQIQKTIRANKTEENKEDGGESSNLTPDTFFPSELFEATIDDVWGLVALVDVTLSDSKILHAGKFQMNAKTVEPWFLKWWREIQFGAYDTQDDFEKILFPTYALSDKNGWRQATKWLYLNTSAGQISE